MPILSQGNTYTLTYNIKNADNSIKDLSGTLELKYALAKRASIAPLISFDLNSSQLNITDAAQGVLELKLLSTDLNQVPDGLYRHEIWQVNALGDPTTLLAEDVIITSKLIKE